MRSVRRDRGRRQGFTLMEVLLVLLLLAFLGGMAFLAIGGAKQTGNKRVAKIAVQEIDKAIRYYQLISNRLPNQLGDLLGPTPVAGGALPEKPAMEKDPGLDPWEQQYRYELGNDEWRIWSAGPDLQDGTEDDIYP